MLRLDHPVKGGVTARAIVTSLRSDQIPTARARFSGGNAVVMSESVAGMTNAAPNPATARAMISCSGLLIPSGASEAAMKIARPTANCFASRP